MILPYPVRGALFEILTTSAASGGQVAPGYVTLAALSCVVPCNCAGSTKFPHVEKSNLVGW